MVALLDTRRGTLDRCPSCISTELPPSVSRSIHQIANVFPDKKFFDRSEKTSPKLVQICLICRIKPFGESERFSFSARL